MKIQNIRLIVLAVLLLSFFFRPKAQAGSAKHYPEIGKPFQNFRLNNLTNYKSKTATLKDFRGRWLILDFWTASCGTCIASFPKTDSLQKKFGSSLQFILVGYNGGSYHESIRKVYEMYHKKYNLNLTVDYDSALFSQVGVNTVPHLIWIDNRGIVRAITSSREVTRDNIQDFINGKKMNLEEAENLSWYENGKSRFKYLKPLLVSNNGGSDSSFVFRSVLTKWSEQIGDDVPISVESFFHWGNMYVFQVIGGGLADLYKLAYSGRSMNWPNDSLYKVFYPDLVLEISDKDPFNDHTDRNNKYHCYSFIFPAVKYGPGYIQEQLKQDLHTYFGYEVTVETRMMPYWKLVRADPEKSDLITIQSQKNNDSAGQVSSSQTIESLISQIWSNNQFAPPFIDETGIKQNINIDMEGVASNFEEINIILKKAGLALEKGNRLMKVIVIHDPKQSTALKPGF